MKKSIFILFIILATSFQSFGQFDWKFIKSDYGVEFYWKCREELKGQYITTLKIVNTNGYRVGVSVTPTFTVNDQEFKMQGASINVGANNSQVGEMAGLSWYPGGGKSVPSFIFLDYNVKKE